MNKDILQNQILFLSVSVPVSLSLSLYASARPLQSMAPLTSLRINDIYYFARSSTTNASVLGQWFSYPVLYAAAADFLDLEELGRCVCFFFCRCRFVLFVFTSWCLPWNIWILVCLFPPLSLEAVLTSVLELSNGREGGIFHLCRRLLFFLSRGKKKRVF